MLEEDFNRSGATTGQSIAHNRDSSALGAASHQAPCRKVVPASLVELESHRPRYGTAPPTVGPTIELLWLSAEALCTSDPQRGKGGGARCSRPAHARASKLPIRRTPAGGGSPQVPRRVVYPTDSHTETKSGLFYFSPGRRGEKTCPATFA